MSDRSVKLKIMETPLTIKEWVLTEWYGNPAMNLTAYMKKIRGVKVWIWRGMTGLSFTVNAGANSERSYSGGFPDSVTNFNQAIEHVEYLETTKKLF